MLQPKPYFVLSGSASTSVTNEDPARSLSRMISVMELAAANVLRPALRDGELSVGVSVEISHQMPSAEGARIDASARFIGRDGKLYVFEVEASNASGVIGRGLHKRAVVDAL